MRIQNTFPTPLFKIQKDKDKKIILWEVKSFQAIEINKREEEFKDV